MFLIVNYLIVPKIPLTLQICATAFIFTFDFCTGPASDSYFIEFLNTEYEFFSYFSLLFIFISY